MDINHDEQHHIEFEAPHSALSENYPGVPSTSNRPRFSIDLSLELERQLDMESLPSTPAHPDQNHQHQKSDSRTELDPHVLAHIVMQLRQSVAEITKERDDLVELLAVANTHGAELKDALEHMTEKATSMEEELTEVRKKARDDEEAITLLRTKVEESRFVLRPLLLYTKKLTLALQTRPYASPG